ncbi:MAG: glutamate synthase subunit beta [Firmicutes bacterium]|nr:glutamate synthase subunit beta [Bacillota bacterium]
MGKPTGFLEYRRIVNTSEEPCERIKNFNEFHDPISDEERQKQGARCMNCGVPFCQSGMILNGMATGCPLHNLIPEWNDEVYRGNPHHALSRLLKTNNFPEFTGRVCPALCEAACTCGMDGDPVTVKDNELYIIEKGFEDGYMKPNPPKIRTDKKIAIIGSGPSGLAAADQLNKRGHNVTVFEKNDRAGGLLMYGIPNMKLDKKIVERRIQLMKQEGVTFILNTDVGADKKAKEILAGFDAVILCCGASKPRDIDAAGRDAKGIYFAVDFLTENTKSLLDSNFSDKQYVDTKGKSVVIVGGGDTGNDCVGTAIRHGCKSVTQLEIMPEPPKERTSNNQWPQFPRTLKVDYGQEEAIAKFGHDPRIYKTTIKEIISDKKGHIKAVKTVMVNFVDGKFVEIPNSEKVIECDILIVAAGFLGTKDYVPKAFGVEMTPRSNIKTAQDSYATNVKKVFAAGDMHRGQSLVVWAIEEGRSCAKEVDKFLMQYTNMI